MVAVEELLLLGAVQAVAQLVARKGLEVTAGRTRETLAVVVAVLVVVVAELMVRTAPSKVGRTVEPVAIMLLGLELLVLPVQVLHLVVLGR
jgi:K+-transporting ATPase A subunit